MRKKISNKVLNFMGLRSVFHDFQAQELAAKESQRPVYPFPAIVGQDEMKLCLLLNVIDPKIGGVMIMGDRGGEPGNPLLLDPWLICG